jgi:hypothetical protein
MTGGVNQAAVSRERRTQPRGCANGGWRARSWRQERPAADGGDGADRHGRPLANTRRFALYPPRCGTHGSDDLIEVGGQQQGQTERTHCLLRP